MAADMIDASVYLKRPYARIVTPEADGTFRGEILELPGCIATGDTPEEALSELESAAKSWLEAALESNQAIPAPLDSNEYSGRLVLRLPRSLHKKAARVAERERVSLNQFIVAALAEQIGERRSRPTTALSYQPDHPPRAMIRAFELIPNEGAIAEIMGVTTQSVRHFLEPVRSYPALPHRYRYESRSNG
ncbi:MAG TPA: type II toxin-antitoxin system HicB family antitoxin [Acetobacteraceae bacterium]